MKTGLGMEGGAMRGMFTCGVTDVFLENGVSFDGAAGISAGAVFGCNLKSRQAGRAIRYNKAWARDSRYGSFRSLLRTGDYYGADFCYRLLPDELDPFDRRAFRENPMTFYAGATDVRTGRIVYHPCLTGDEKDMRWLRASASMPFFSRPVETDGFLLLDGGIADPVPYAWLRSQGYEKLTLILTQPRGYRKKRSALLPAARLMLLRYPALWQALRDRSAVYNRQMDEIDRDEANGAVFVIRPSEPLRIRRTEDRPEELERVYQAGRAEALRTLGALRRFLQAPPAS